MKVLFIPASPNPYQRELASALGRLGVDAQIGEPKRLLPVLREVANRGRPDILHLHWIDPLALGNNPILTAVKGLRLMAELVVLRLLGVRIVWTVHNLIDHEERSPRLQMLINRVIARIAHRLIVHSRAAGDIVCQAFKVSSSQVSIVPHASFGETYENHISRKEARRRLGLAENSLIFLHFGLLREYKGTRHLLRRFQQLKLPRARLLIAGQPLSEEVADSVMAAAAEDSRIVPELSHVDEDAVQVYMNAADVVVLPYKRTLTSGVALLAMGFGKPVIAPNVPVMNEVLAAEANLLYNAENGTALSAAMEQAGNSDLEAMGESNRATASELSWQRMARQTKDVYLAVLSVS